MPYNTSVPELITAAFEAADVANQARQAMQNIQADIRDVEHVQSLNLDIIVPASAHQALREELEDHRRDFEVALNMAGVVFGRPLPEETVPDEAAPEETNQTIQVESETVNYAEVYPDIDFGDPVRGKHDLIAFTERQPEPFTLKRITNLVIKTGVAIGDDHAFDIRALYATVDLWIKDPSLYEDIVGIGPKSVSILAEFVNGAIPGLEPHLLPITQQPEGVSGESSKRQPISRMGKKKLSELLLDTVEIDGETAALVSCRGIIRFAQHQGERPRALGSKYWLLVASLARLANEGTLPEVKAPTNPATLEPRMVDSRGLAVLGIHKTTGGSVERIIWGFTPELFAAAAIGVENNPALAKKLQGYTETSKATLKNYLKALRRINPQV